MAHSADSRVLASWLAGQDDAALTALLTERGISPSATWADFFDAAEGVQDAAPLARALAALPRPLAEALVAAQGGTVAEPARSALISRALAAPDGTVYRAVVQAIAAAPPAATPSEAPRPDPEPADAAAERAFTAAATLADILQLALTTPLSRIGSGALGATERRRLMDAGIVTDAATADELVALSSVAGLTAPTDKEWFVTADGLEWLQAGTVERWDQVARRLRDALPAALRTDDGGWSSPAEWAQAYPFDPTWPARAEQWRSLLHRWALIGPDGSSAPWARGLAAGGDADLDALRSLLPPEVDRVFLQNDLTAIAPGPLAPHLDMRLRTMALRESRAQASSYRFTPDSIGAAITGGETAESLRDFLTALSLTGLPQPLAYEIERTAARHGLIRVVEDPASGVTLVRSDDRAVLDTLAVDQALRSLALMRHSEGLTSRSNADAVFWALADARYPVSMEDTSGHTRTVLRHKLAAPPAPPTASPYEPLIGRLRGARESDSDAAWLGRELEQAVRAKALITVTVRLPDGSSRDFTLEASGLGGGRLRGRDKAADVERTLPVASIEAVRAL
ncbi:helicase-associated domain-containing protein [Microbacterium sp. zg-Y818]|uniref:helicase-associated domain-containing protein n=1 Tax=unclassified Microbacterium TaxID=2609290 RepID=UPI00214C88F2|nr:MULTISPECIES: helicase-associated domain-containing protein [unclassified Microbacterium]MCR2799511.1 helicase-associated domain-containing protein [Microbacterium sp. zg.Y818]WIM21506.1 helicase-associated domain-containing protein [Microbacterium sp. zg-Y818]